MGTTTDWRPLFVASAALMLRVKAKKKWPGWSDADREAAKSACLQAAADIEGIPDLRARAEAAEQRAEAAEAEAEAAEQRAEALAAELAQAQADARVLACQWRAVDDIEDLQFFGACWREAHPGRSEGDLGRDPTMADLVAALRRALGGAA